MLLLSDSKSKKKLTLAKLIVSKENLISHEAIQAHISESSYTVKKIIDELNSDMEYPILNKKNDLYIIKYKINVYEYYRKLCISDLLFKILKSLLFANKVYTLNSLALELYISKSKLYSLIKSNNKKLAEFDIEIQINTCLKISGKKSSIFSLIYEMNEIGLKEYINWDSKSASKQLIKSIHAHVTPLSISLFSKWYETYLLYKKINTKKNLIIIDDLKNKILVTDIKKHKNFFELVAKEYSSIQNIEFSDIFLLYLGLFSSNLEFEHVHLSSNLNNIHLDFFLEDSLKKLSIDLVGELASLLDFEITAWFKNAISVILLNYDYLILNYMTYASVVLPSDYSEELRKNFQELPSVQTLSNLGYNIEVLRNIIWLVCKRMINKHYFGKKKLSFISIMGSKTASDIKDNFVTNLFYSDTFNHESQNDILWVVDDPRIAPDENYIELDRLINFISSF